MEDLVSKILNMPQWVNIVLFVVGGIFLAGQGIESKFLGVSFYPIFQSIWDIFLSIIA